MERRFWVIEYASDNDGMIQGRSRAFNAKSMAEYCRSLDKTLHYNTLTREYGIRQQAMYIMYYNKNQ